MFNSCYRLQLNSKFTFNDAVNILPYLKELGISCIYLSPVMQATPGSTHGYDVTDINQVNIELGGEKELSRLLFAFKKMGLAALIDFVPNHMSASQYNKWWRDVLENKEASQYAKLFDINWHQSAEKLHFRRFFDINDLVCMNTHIKEIFAMTHRKLFEILRENAHCHLRIDHIDGLRDPLSYLNLLKEELQDTRRIYVEKILARNERLLPIWPVDGTTGYDFLNQTNQLFIDQKGLEKLIKDYCYYTNKWETVYDIRYQSSITVINKLFHHELLRLTDELAAALNTSLDKSHIKDFIINISAFIPVYRTYIDNHQLNPVDAKMMTDLLNLSISDGQNFQVIQKGFEDFFANPEKFAHTNEILHWLLSWQVFTAPVVAKGFEDTACYRYNPLLSLNEVGSHPDFYSDTGNVKIFHQYNLYKLKNYPVAINTTSTHDTKRSEDVRARLNVLSELSGEWNNLLPTWTLINQDKKMTVNGLLFPDVNTEIFIYQTLLSSWPLSDHDETSYLIRIEKYLSKSAREAKTYSSWQTPNLEYENAINKFCELILTIKDSDFYTTFRSFHEKIAFYGMLNSLSQTTLKILSPGIPDFYPGNEIFRFDLVDPDNRREVDFKMLAQQLLSLPAKPDVAYLSNLFSHWKDGRLKLFLIKTLLTLRNEINQKYNTLRYIPIYSEGKMAQHFICFLRTNDSDISLLVIVPRYFTKLINLGELRLDVDKSVQLKIADIQHTSFRSVFSNSQLMLKKKDDHFYLQLNEALRDFPIGVFLND